MYESVSVRQPKQKCVSQAQSKVDGVCDLALVKGVNVKVRQQPPHLLRGVNALDSY